MAPTKERAKEKTKKASGDDAVDLILQYLRKQNRPYSATDISANLHNQVTKSAAAKILKDLHERQQIEGRASGKQLVYHTIQDPSAAASPEQLVSLDTRVESLREETAALKGQATNLRTELTALNATMSTSDLHTAVCDLEARKSEVQVRLEALKTGDAKPVRKEERQAIDAELEKWAKVEKARQKIRMDMWNTCLEYAANVGLDVEELKEQMGITGV